MSYPSDKPVSRHGKQTDQLHERYELFESFINQSSEGICLFDQNGRILEWNAGCEVYFGIPYAEAIQKYIWDVQYEVIADQDIAHKSLEKLKKAYFRMMEEVRENKTKLIERRINTRKNVVRYISISLFPIVTESRKLFGAIIKDMTKIKQYEDTLNKHTSNLENLVEERNAEIIESERKFRQLAENINDVLVTYTSDNEIIYTSPNFRELFERDPDMFKADPNTYFEWTDPADSKKVAKLVQDSLAGKRDRIDSKHRIHLPSGDIKWVWLRITVIRNTVKSTKLWLATFTDITRQKHYEQQLTAKNAELETYENKVKNLFSIMRDGLVRTDLYGRILECNQAFCEMIRCKDEQIRQTSIKQITPEAYHAIDDEVIQHEVLQKGSSRLYEKEFIRNGDRQFPAEVQIYLIREQDEPVGFWLIIQDITERLKAQKELQDSETTYREIYNATTDAIFVHNVETGKIIDVNNAMLQMYGYTYQEAINIDVAQISDNDPPYSQKEADELLNRALQANEVIHFEWYDKRKNGDRFWTHNAMRTATINGVKRLIVVSRDITERKEAEEIIRKNEQYLESILENMPIGVGVSDIEGNTLFYNKKFTEDTGYTLEDLPTVETWIKKSTPDIAWQRQILQEWKNMTVHLKDENFVSPTRELVVRTKSGQEKTFEVVVKRHGNKIISLFNDITDKRLAELELENYRHHLEALVKQRTKEIHKLNKGLSKKNMDLEKALQELKTTQTKMVQSEKMVSIGMLTAGIAHEINNPINFINTGVEGLKMAMNDLQKWIDFMKETEVSEQDGFIDKLKGLKNKIDFADLDESIRILLNNMETGVYRTTEIVQSLRSFARSNDLDYDDINVNDNIKSTLVILYHNYKNRITIHTNYGSLPFIKAYTGKINQVLMNLLANAIQAIEDKGEITIETGLIKDEIYVSIKDTGKGIPIKYQDKIFEPFFTTKPAGEGTGLGLSISRNIMNEHHGRIELNSVPDNGTEFCIYLPVKATPKKE